MAKDGSALAQGYTDGDGDQGRAASSRGEGSDAKSRGAAGVGEDEVHLDPAAEGRAGLGLRRQPSKLASQTGVADGSGLRSAASTRQVWRSAPSRPVHVPRATEYGPQHPAACE